MSPQGIVRPLLGGAPLVSSDGDSFGTFGCLCRDKKNPDRLLMLTAAHVVALDGTTGRVIRQGMPNSPQREVGRLLRWAMLKPGKGHVNLVDAAAAVPTVDDVKPNIVGLGLPSGVATASVDDCVRACGAASGDVKEGKVTELDYGMHYKLGGKRYEFRGLVRCTPFTRRGDSGAVVLNKNRKVVGLVIGLAPGGDTVFTPIAPVLNLLRLEIA